MLGRRSYLIFLFGLLTLPGLSQDKSDRKWFVNGYLKDLVTFNFVNESPLLPEKELLVDNLIHNRINFKWYPSDNFSAFIEFRNRLFHGDLVNIVPNYSQFIDVNNDYFDLSVNVVDRDKVVLHSMIDRFYIQWNRKDWEIKLGRQRINWGTNLVWNPNDLFNAYSFFDFDYEERPGSDALRIQRYTGFASSIEFAVNVANDISDFVAAGMWKVNVSGYDLQFLSGVANENIALGVGWAGNVGTSGFKGEMTYFEPFEVTSLNERSYIASLTWDYNFSNSLYLMWSGLYNSAGTFEPSQLPTGLNTTQRLTAKNLSFYKFSSIIQSAYPIHPLVNVGLAWMLFPGDNAMFIYPTVSWSIIENLDLDIFGQFFWDDPSGELESTSKLIFVRTKWELLALNSSIFSSWQY